MQTIEVETVKSDALWRVQSIIEGSQPADEIKNVGIAPHPCWKPLETAEGLDCVRIRNFSLHIAIDPVCIGPVALYRNRAKALIADETLRDSGALPVELVRSVRGLAEENKASISDQLEQGVVIGGRTCQRMCGLADEIGYDGLRRINHDQLLEFVACQSVWL
jgi:hypothetical protein